MDLFGDAMFQLSRRQLLVQTAGAAALGVMSGTAAAGDYPSRQIRLVIPYPPGGAGDQIGRFWAGKITSLLGPAYVENIGGAGGTLGSSMVAQSMPDGYTLLLGNGSTQVMIPAASAHPAYDTARDFQAIYRLITTTLAFVVHPSLPVNDMRELVAYARSNPGKLSYGTPGVGTGNHLVGEMLRQRAGGAEIVHIPYRGISLATNDLVAGRIPLMIAVVSGSLQQLNQSGQLRVLAVTSETRLRELPEVPTVAESGMPDLSYAGWFGLFAPKATPAEIVDRIAEATRVAMADSALQEAYRAQGMEPDTNSSPGKFQGLVQDEVVRLTPLIRSIGLSRD
jgi:tripartite-type tricarboxylate transporter receptor subunit TctC